MNFLSLTLVIGYFLIALMFLIIIDKVYNYDDNNLRKQQADAGLIICSIFWLPLLFVFIFCFSIKNFIGKANEKNEKSNLQKM